MENNILTCPHTNQDCKYDDNSVTCNVCSRISKSEYAKNVMKTIEERAEECANKTLIKSWMVDDLFFVCKDGYIKGALDQREIDIDKACETFKATCKEQGAGSCDREWLCNGCAKYEAFCKRMKGE